VVVFKYGFIVFSSDSSDYNMPFRSDKTFSKVKKAVLGTHFSAHGRLADEKGLTFPQNFYAAREHSGGGG
jgi:hypothetical protein